MGTRASRREFIDEPFVLRFEDVQKIFSFVENLGAKVTFSIKLEDKVTRTYQSIDDLKNIENTSKNPIVSLDIAARKKDYSLDFSCSWETSSHSRTWISISGDEGDVIAISEVFNNRILAMRPWYSFFTKGDLIVIVFSLVFIITLIMSALALFLLADKPFVPSEKSKAEAPAIAILFLVFVFAGTWLLEKFRKKIFPKQVFALGQGVDRNEFMEKVRWSVVVGFVVSAAVSAIFVLI